MSHVGRRRHNPTGKLESTIFLLVCVPCACLPVSENREAPCLQLLEETCSLDAHDNNAISFCRACEAAKWDPKCADAPDARAKFSVPGNSCQHVLCQDAWLDVCGIDPMRPTEFNGRDCSSSCGALLTSPMCKDHPAIADMQLHFGPASARCKRTPHLPPHAGHPEGVMQHGMGSDTQQIGSSKLVPVSLLFRPRPLRPSFARL